MIHRVIVFLFICACAQACKKDKDSGGPDSIVGYWTGNWQFGDAPDAGVKPNMAVIFRENMTIRVVYGYVSDTSGGFRSEGTYSYNGGVVTFTYNEDTDFFTHKGNVSGNKMKGTWGETPSDSNGGLWELSNTR